MVVQTLIITGRHEFGEIFGEKGLCPDHGAEVMEVKSQWEVRIGGCLGSKGGFRSVGMQVMVALWWAVVEGWPDSVPHREHHRLLAGVGTLHHPTNCSKAFL